MSPSLIKEVSRTLSQLAEGDSLEYFREAATEQALEFINEGKEILKRVKEGTYKHFSLDIYIKLQAPVIVLPCNLLDLSKPCIVVDAGLIVMSSKLLKETAMPKELRVLQKAKSLYDRYDIAFSEF